MHTSMPYNSSISIFTPLLKNNESTIMKLYLSLLRFNLHSSLRFAFSLFSQNKIYSGIKNHNRILF